MNSSFIDYYFIMELIKQMHLKSLKWHWKIVKISY